MFLKYPRMLLSKTHSANGSLWTPPGHFHSWIILGATGRPVPSDLKCGFLFILPIVFAFLSGILHA
jgi:hypothetical protein